LYAYSSLYLLKASRKFRLNGVESSSRSSQFDNVYLLSVDDRRRAVVTVIRKCRKVCTSVCLGLKDVVTKFEENGLHGS
jgi:hypothetical protein